MRTGCRGFDDRQRHSRTGFRCGNPRLRCRSGRARGPWRETGQRRLRQVAQIDPTPFHFGQHNGPDHTACGACACADRQDARHMGSDSGGLCVESIDPVAQPRRQPKCQHRARRTTRGAHHGRFADGLHVDRTAMSLCDLDQFGAQVDAAADQRAPFGALPDHFDRRMFEHEFRAALAQPFDQGAPGEFGRDLAFDTDEGRARCVPRGDGDEVLHDHEGQCSDRHEDLKFQLVRHSVEVLGHAVERFGQRTAIVAQFVDRVSERFARLTLDRGGDVADLCRTHLNRQRPHRDSSLCPRIGTVAQ
ncbi:hypothetical protein D5S18_17410 [Nocardia panacis]|uniref:Uncharacterized protein n=1 Tax=Nocardia panacis TaxID=2340916 RepID=A0A3A4KM89_9NOCA|nr:hypothetical protein D5S18_17410 [Nocardia panacis]